jgi:hypothetical protein
MAFLSGAPAGPRRVVLTLTIVCFAVAAAMGIAALVRPGSFDQADGKVLLTTVAVGCASIVVLCYLAVVPTRFAWLAYAGGVCAVTALATALLLVWHDWGAAWSAAGEIAQVFGVATTWGATIAQGTLLLALAAPPARDWRALRVVLIGTQACAVVVAGIVTALIVVQDATEGGVRALGVIAILDVLGTVVTVALARFGHGPSLVGVPLPAGLAAALDQRARQAGRSRDDLVREAVTRYLGAGDD